MHRVSQAFSSFSFFLFLAVVQGGTSLRGNCCVSEHELLVTVSARGSNPGTVTGVTWLLSSFFLASWSDEQFYFFLLHRAAPPLCRAVTCISLRAPAFVFPTGGRTRVARFHSWGVRSKKYGDGGLGNDFSHSVRGGYGSKCNWVTAACVTTPARAAEKSSCLQSTGRRRRRLQAPSHPLVSRRSVTVAAKSASSRLSLSLHTCRPGLCVDRRHNEDFRKRGKSAKGCYKYIHKVTHTIYVYKIRY